MNNKTKQFISALTLSAVIVTTFVGTLGAPKPAAGLAFIGNLLDPSVPVEGDGGFFDTINVQPTFLGDAMISSIGEAGAIRATEAMGSAFSQKLDEKVAIKDFSGYEQALVNSKNFANIMRQRYGDDVLQGSLGDVYQIARLYEDMGINKTLSAEQARQLGLGRGQTALQHQKQITKLIVGATAMFTSSISCAGINRQAINNTANYLAGASAGVVASEIRANSGIKFYQDLAKLGSPLSNPAFWELSFADSAAQAESQARSAAALEISSPGIKSPQTRNAVTGLPQVGSSQTLIKSSQEQSIASIFGTTRNAGTIRFPTNSFSAFIKYVGFLYAQGAISKLGGWLGGLLGNLIGGNIGAQIGKIIGKISTNSGWVIQAQTYGHFVAEQITKSFVKAMFDRVISMVFRGTLLEESLGCRLPVKLTAFRSDINTAQLAQNALNNVKSGAVFTVIPDTVNRGDAATLTWDASGYGDASEVSVSLSGVGPVGLTGTREVRPTATTTYTLTVNKSGETPQTFTQLLTVVDSGTGSGLFLSAVPDAIQKGDATTLAWDASVADAGMPISISTIGTVEATGSVEVQPEATTTYVMTATIGGQPRTVATTVTVSDTPPNQPDFAKVQYNVLPQALTGPGNVTVSWNATQLTDVEVYITPLSEGNLALSGSQTYAVTGTTPFTIIVTNMDGDMVGTKTITVTVAAPQPGVPTISSVAPTSGKAGDPVIITGTNFSANGIVLYLDEVWFGPVGSTQSGTKINFLVPPNTTVPPGSYQLRIKNENGVFSAPAPQSFTITDGSGAPRQ